MARHNYKLRTHDIGQRLLALRNQTRLTQTELGQLIGVSRRSILKWEGGEGVPNGAHLQHMLEVFAARKAFTAGQERAEAEALWEAVSQAATKRLGRFNTPWFEQLLAQQGMEDATSQPSPIPHSLSPIIDWGEAIDAPTLYGRTAELAHLHQWVLADRCRMVTLLGLGGIGKTSLALTFIRQALPRFEVVLFRSLQNGPSITELLDQIIRTVSEQHTTPPEQVADKIGVLVQLLRERRCLLMLDNFESLMQADALTGTYRTGYAAYGELLRALSERDHQSCLIVTSREKPAELGVLEGRSSPVRTLALAGLDDSACQIILEAKDIAGTPADVGALARLYGGNPLALQLIAEPIRELFGGDVSAFLSTGDAFFNGVGMLLQAQFARSTPLEQAILYWLTIERELVPLHTLLADLGEGVPQRAVLAALESLRRRLLIERAPDRPAFSLQPVIIEYLTDRLVETVAQEVLEAHPQLVSSHAIMQATTKEYVRHSQERLIATPVLEQLGSPDALERQLLALLAFWHGQPLLAQGYGPGNTINLLRLALGHLRGLDLAGLAIRQAYLQGVEMHDTSLAGASIRDSVFTEAFGIIHAVAASPDSTYWAASSVNGMIQVWRDDGWTTHLSILAHTKQAITLAFSPDGQTLASGSYDCTIKLWDMANGALIRSLEGHSDYVQSVAFAPDGKLLVSGSDDRTIRLWDVGSGACLQTLDAHTDNVYGVAWSPDGNLVASCSFDRTLRVWDVASGRCVQTLAGHTRPVCKLTFSPDGQLLASGGFDSMLKIWDLANGQCLQTFAEHTSAVKAIAWSPDGHLIASSSYDGTICLWERNGTTALRVLQGHAASVNSIAFTADGTRLISGSDDHTMRVWDVAHGWCVRILQGYGLFFFAVVWSPDGQRLLSANSNATLTVWSVAAGRILHTLHGHTHTVYAAAWSPDGKWLASGGFDQTIRIWDAATGVCVRVIQAHADIVYRVAWSPDGRSLASASRDQTVRIWNPATGVPRWIGRSHTDPINEVVWSPDGRRLASCSEDRTVRVWRAEDGMLLLTLVGHARSVAGIAWSPDGRKFASCGGGGSTGEVFLWDAESGALLQSFIGHASVVFRVAWSIDGTMLFSGGVTGNMRWWDVASGSCLHTRHGHRGWIRSLSTSPDGATLVSSGEDGIIQLWNIARAEHIRTLRASRPYERLNIMGISGLTEAQKASLIALGAIDTLGEREAVIDVSPKLVDTMSQHRPPPALASGLPFQPTPFIGRGSEMTQIAALLADQHCRVLTLHGPGGIGKTRLALAVAASQIAVFAAGVTFVALASVNTPSQIVSAIGDALGLSFAGQADPTTQLLDYLRERQMLIVLDNFEHVLDGADLVSALLAHAPDVTVLITSRERLNLQAEWVFEVDGLAYPPPDLAELATPQGVAALTDYSAIQLFVQRARQAQPVLALSEATLMSMVRICQHLAGMPLAIELAAASMRTLSLAAVEQQIGAQLDGLTTSFRDVPIRHRSMRAVFDHSWQLLSAEERALFSHLAVFRGGWTAEAAEAVAAELRIEHVELKNTSHEQAILNLLRALVNKSLVRQASAEPRFLMLEPIREYALERLAMRSDAAIIRQRHAHYFVALAEAAAAEWNTPMSEAAVARQRHEYDNMRAALQWALDSGNSTLGLRLAQALWRFWRSYSYTSEGRAWLEQLLTLDEHPADLAAIAARRHGLQAAAWLASDQHDFGTATRLFEQSRALRHALGETEGETELLINAARQARVVGQYQRATALLEDVLARHRAIGDRTALGSAELGLAFDELGLVLRELGLVQREQGNFTRAAALFAEALALHRAIDDRASVAFELLGLADVARDQGDAAGVREYGEPSLVMLRELGIEWAIGFALHTLAQGTYYAGDLPQALALIRESVALFRRLKAEGSLAEVLITLAAIARAQGDRTAAATALTEALHYAWAVGPRLMVAAALEQLASVVVNQNQTQLAVRYLAAASTLRVQMGTPVRPIDQATLITTQTTAQSVLGADAFAAAWAAAQALPLEQIFNTIPGVVMRN